MKVKHGIELLAVFCFLAFVSCAGAASASEKEGTSDPVSEARLLYERGDYAKAVLAFEDIISKGVKKGNIYYDLGNAYLKAGDISRAILNYERAGRVMPRDRDLVFNLNKARSMMKQKDMFPGAGWLKKSLIKNSEKVTYRETVIILMLLWYFLAFCVVPAVFFKGTRPVLFVISAVIVFFMCWEYGVFNEKARDMKEGAIVISALIDARIEPMPDSQKLFPLYGGMKIKIKREEKDWVKIQKMDGKIGWIEGKDVEKITSS